MSILIRKIQALLICHPYICLHLLSSGFCVACVTPYKKHMECEGYNLIDVPIPFKLLSSPMPCVAMLINI